MQRRLGSVTAIGRRIGLNDDQGFGLPVFLALIVVIAVVIGFYAYFVTSAQPEPYNTMYLLDGNNKAVDYPHMLIVGQNSTFGVNLTVVNHMNSEQNYEVRTKIAKTLLMTSNGTEATAIDTYSFTLPNQGSNQHTVTVTENTPGSYMVVYELWSTDSSGNFSFTGNYCELNIQVTD